MAEQLNLRALEHLALANDVRTTRAKDKKLIKGGYIAASPILLDPPVHWRNAKVIDLLLAMPHTGRVRANKWLMMERVNPGKPIEEIPHPQRLRLAKHLNVYNSVRRDNLRRQLETAA